MPVNPLSEIKKGVEKTKFSLSLNRNNATHLSKENIAANTNKESSSPGPSDDKENKPVKRPLKSTYYNTLNAAKKLKPLTEIVRAKGIF